MSLSRIRRVHALAVLVGLVPFASGLAQGVVQGPQIVTTGFGEAIASSDRATISVSVLTRGTSVEPASADNARRVRAVMDTLKSLGIAADQIETSNYNVSPEMQYPTTNQTPRVSGYTVTNSVLVRLRRIEDVGRVIDASLAKGANEISSLQFTSSKADSVRAVALAAAVADARSQAEAMARAAGGSLGALLELNTSVPVRPMPVMQNFAMRAAPTPIAPAPQDVSATVTGRWAFVSGR